MKDTVYFVSDTHFKYHSSDDHEREKRSAFLGFLEMCRGASRLYLGGDIFDFWFEYGSVIPGFYHDILCGLSTLRASGTEIFITGGNHDHWFGPWLKERIGVELLGRYTTIELQGRRIVLTHGDLEMPGDYGYKILKTIIRCRPVVFLARLVHPDILFSFARWFSRASKGITHRRTVRYADSVTAAAEERFFSDGNDVFIMGHIHLPRMRRFGEKTFVILGDWESHRSYLRLEDGELSLESYQSDGKTVIENL